MLPNSPVHTPNNPVVKICLKGVLKDVRVYASTGDTLRAVGVQRVIAHLATLMIESLLAIA